MKALVISKPVYDYILPLAEFPSDGDRFYIDKCTNSLSSFGSMVALTLGKYGEDVDFTGVVGDDEVAKKIKEIFDTYQVKTKYIETCYTEKSLISYKIYNKKSNKFTTINEIGAKTGLIKYKYEFIPDVVVMDDKDYNANLAALNNFPESLLIYIADKYTKESNVYLNKCRYVISNLNFASDACGLNNMAYKEKNLVMLFQKFIDLYNTNLIIKLDNFDLLYCINDEVRIIRNINKNIINKESVYISVLIYFLTKKYDVEEAIKLTNKAMLESKSEIDLIQDIPDYSIIEKITKEYEEYKKAHNIIDNNVINQQNNINNVNQNNINNTIQNNVNNVNQNNTIDNQSNMVNNVSQSSNLLEEQQMINVTPVELHNPNTDDIEKLTIDDNNNLNIQNTINNNTTLNNQNNINNNGVNNE